MTATTKPVVPKFSSTDEFIDEWSITSGTPTLYLGAGVARNSSGVVVDPTETTGLRQVYTFVGMSPNNPSSKTQLIDGVLTSAASGTKILVSRQPRWWKNGESIAETDIGKVAYVDDNVTVKKTSTSTSPVGVILRVDSTEGVLVDPYPADQAIPDGSVTTAKLAAGAVDTTELAADAVEGTKIADNAVNSEHIAAGAIDPAHLAPGVREIANDAPIALVNTDRHIEIADCTAGVVISTTSSVAGQQVRIRLLARTSNAITLVAQGGTLTWDAAGEEALIVRNAANDAWIPFVAATPATIV